MTTVTLALHAMATRFELVLHGASPVALRAAGEEALDEIARLEEQLSLYRPGSEIAHLNARAAREPVRVTPGLFALLEHARRLHHETGGAFDITIAPLVRCWGFMGGTGSLPDPAAVAAARSQVGMDLVELNAADFTVRFAQEGVMLDLGAIGKGYAIGRAIDLLREAGITSALLHGGTSTACAIGRPPDADAWKLAIAIPHHAADVPAGLAWGQSLGSPAQPPRLATVPLVDAALSVSAVWGRSFQAGGKRFGHILDPRTGQPAAGALLAAVASPSATETDALSTALLVLSTAGHNSIDGLRPGMRTLLVAESAGALAVDARGIEVGPPAAQTPFEKWGGGA